MKSLLLLSSLFNVSLDILIKGYLEEMKEQIKKEDKVPFFGSYVWFYSQINLSQSNFNIFYWNFYIILTSLWKFNKDNTKYILIWNYTIRFHTLRFQFEWRKFRNEQAYMEYNRLDHRRTWTYIYNIRTFKVFWTQSIWAKPI